MSNTLTLALYHAGLCPSAAALVYNFPQLQFPSHAAGPAGGRLLADELPGWVCAHL